MMWMNNDTFVVGVWANYIVNFEIPQTTQTLMFSFYKK